MTEPPPPLSTMHWSRWGDPAKAHPVSTEMRTLVEAFLGPLEDRPAVEQSAVTLPAVGLEDRLVEELTAIVGAGHLHTDDTARLARTRGKSTPDLLRMRSGDASDAPDAVVRPAGHAQIVELLRWAGKRKVALVPFGGGTSVVGGLAARREGYAGVVSLDLRRLTRLLDLDEVSGTATLEAGLLGPEAEALLAERGYMLGHYPQSFEFATIGGFAAARSSGQSSAGYGRFDSMVLGLRAATPVGELAVGRGPANAAGPDLRQLLLGSEGAFGVITEVTVRIRPLPGTKVYEGWRFPFFADGADAMRRLAQADALPTVLRLSDESETAVNLARPDAVGASQAGPSGEGGCLMIVGYEGTEASVERARTAATEVLSSRGEPLGTEPGEGWLAGRFDGPYLRDALLDVGVLVETFETVTSWSNLQRLHTAARDAVTAALADQGTPPMVLCHISHVYPSGASLYFTVAARELADGVGQWTAAKQAVSDAIVEAGGSITHHHGIGRDHRPWLAAEIGAVGVEVLRAVKHQLDPRCVLNPGILVP